MPYALILNVFADQEKALSFQDEVTLRGQTSQLKEVQEEGKIWFWVYLPCESEEHCQKLVQEDVIFFENQDYIIKKI